MCMCGGVIEVGFFATLLTGAVTALRYLSMFFRR